MDVDQLITAIGQAVEGAKPAQEYCLLWLSWWPMCMTKGEWSGWVQAVGSIAAIGGAAWGVQHSHTLQQQRSDEERGEQITERLKELYFLCNRLSTVAAGISEVNVHKHSEAAAPRIMLEALAEALGRYDASPVTSKKYQFLRLHAEFFARHLASLMKAAITPKDFSFAASPDDIRDFAEEMAQPLETELLKLHAEISVRKGQGNVWD